MGCGSSKPSNSAVVQEKIASGEYDAKDYEDREFYSCTDERCHFILDVRSLISLSLSFSNKYIFSFLYSHLLGQQA